MYDQAIYKSKQTEKMYWMIQNVIAQVKTRGEAHVACMSWETVMNVKERLGPQYECRAEPMQSGFLIEVKMRTP